MDGEGGEKCEIPSDEIASRYRPSKSKDERCNAVVRCVGGFGEGERQKGEGGGWYLFQPQASELRLSYEAARQGRARQKLGASR